MRRVRLLRAILARVILSEAKNLTPLTAFRAITKKKSIPYFDLRYACILTYMQHAGIIAPAPTRNQE